MAESSLVRLQAYVEEHQAGLYRLAYSYLKNRDDALDAVQESIARAIDRLPSLRSGDRLHIWMTRIVVNECLTRLRRRKPVVPLEDWDGAEEEHDRDELWDLRKSIDALDPKLRTVVILRFFEDRKLEEIAQITRTPLSTVKTRLYRALAQLRLHLEEQEVLS